MSVQQTKQYPAKPKNLQKKANQALTEINNDLMKSFIEVTKDKPVNDSTTATMKTF